MDAADLVRMDENANKKELGVNPIKAAWCRTIPERLIAVPQGHGLGLPCKWAWSRSC
jgi:hypothetical protein